MDSTTMAVGQAIAFRMNPTRDSPKEFGKRLAVSPTTLRASPLARRIQGALLLPDSTAKPPTTRPRSSTSPIGYARFVTVASTLAPADCWMP